MLLWVALGALGLFSICVGAVLSLTRGQKPPLAIQTSMSHSERAPRADQGYLGPQACAECHRERVAEFSKTKHFAACCVPRDDAMPAGFLAGNGHFQSRIAPVEFEMGRSEQGWTQTATLQTPAGKQQTTSLIDLKYGSSPTDEVYFTWRGDRLYELPIAWLHPQKSWGSSTFDPDGEGDFSRPMTPRCLECHNTWFEHQPGTLNQYNRDTFILGVTCERCHGPGREHVTYHRQHPAERLGTAIVKPAQLSRERLLDVCGQCHSNAIKHRGPAFSYRPGQPLEESYRMATSRHPEEDHVANQMKYMRESKCFQQSETLTCITCHDPHKVSTSTTDHSSSATSCLKCHQIDRCSQRPHVPVAVQDNCAGCHMPARNKIQVHFETESDSKVAPVKAYEHRIAIYPTATQEVLYDWYRQQPGDDDRRKATELASTLSQHWIEEAERCRRDHRLLAAMDAYRNAIRFVPSAEIQSRLTEATQLRTAIDEKWFQAIRLIRQEKYPEAIVTLEAMLQINPDLAKVHGKLGAVYATLGQREKATSHLKLVATLAPDDAYGAGMLGWISFLDGNYETAIEQYKIADEIEPYNAKVHYQWGLALQKLQSWPSAEDRFRTVLEIDPNHFNACLNLSLVLRSQGKRDEAVSFAQRAVTITTQQNPELLLNLAECHADAGQTSKALQTIKQALLIAQKNRPELVPRIRRRLDELGKSR